MLQLRWQDYVLVDGWTHRHQPQWLLFARAATPVAWSHASRVIERICQHAPETKAQLQAFFEILNYEVPDDTTRALEHLLGPPWPSSGAPGPFARLLVLQREHLKAARPRVPTPVDYFKPAPLSAIQSWVVIACVDNTPQARPIAGVKLQVITAAGDVRTALTNAQGSVLVDRIAPGQVTIRVLDLDGALWRPLEGDAATPSPADQRFAWHTVKQGECLSTLAHRYGFRSWQDIWKHPKNAALRDKRKSPHVLYPGDQVALPGLRLCEIARQTEQTHTIEVKPKALAWLRLKLLDEKRRPIETGTYELIVNGEIFAHGAVSNGVVECQVPFDAARRVLRVQSGQRIVERPLEFGALDPLDTPTGVQGRLSNLGYYTGEAGAEDDELTYAANEFREDAGLAPSDAHDDELRTALEREHGI